MCVHAHVCWPAKDGLHCSPMLAYMWPAVVTTVCGQWLRVACFSAFELTHAHLVMGDCTHGVRVTTVYG